MSDGQVSFHLITILFFCFFVFFNNQNCFLLNIYWAGTEATDGRIIGLHQVYTKEQMGEK